MASSSYPQIDLDAVEREMVVLGNEHWATMDPHVVLALIQRLREAEALLAELERVEAFRLVVNAALDEK